MYLQHFNLNSQPFSIAPNPRYVYLSPQHREALAHLLYGLNAGGFVALTGEVGTGKTTLCRCLLEQLPEDVDIALIFNPRLNARELLANLCDELHISHPDRKASIKQLIDLLNHHLLDAHARGRRTVVLIDEAQNLSFDVLEQVRLLTNLETNETKLLQIILVGQPELRDMLGKENLRQLSQRITARYHLRPLSPLDTGAYIQHRLAVAGAHGTLFNRSAIRRIYRLSGGIPRLINLICDRALLGAYTLGKQQVNAAIVAKAATEVLPTCRRAARIRPAIAGLSAAALLAAAGAFYVQSGWRFDPVWPNGLDFRGSPTSGSEAAKPTVSPATTPAVSAADATAQAEPVSTRSGSETPAAAMMFAATAIEQPTAPSPATAAKSDGPAAASSEAAPPPSALQEPKTEPAAASQQTPAPAPELIAEPAAEPSEQANAAKPVDLARWLAESDSSRSAAFGALFERWGSTVPDAGKDECRFARQNALRCLPAPRDWQQLLRLDRPAVLELAMPDGSRRHVALIRRDGDRLVLRIGDRQQTVAEAQLLALWRGDGALLWRPPSDRVVTRPGDHGPAVGWLRQHLALPAQAEQADRFDPRLKAKLIGYQMQNGLQADGTAGPVTVIHMQNADPGDTSPRLGAAPN